ncbi:YcjF family protein [Bauldia litoralis]|uniref:Putative membrane protein n=1 Tax=Bauldia litoralis TaxID=665467 RepID=A0A1G6D889_9HYPH|nr:TIGR01620 family protein [Bauldia litoralis]SDB41404.1 putative membrane protein [Bauldia litoralis]
MSRERRPPTAFDLGDLNVVEADYVPGIGAQPVLAPDSDPFVEDPEIESVEAALPRRGIRWSRWFFAALGGLVTLGIGLAIDTLIRDLFARYDALGWVAVALAALAALALLALAAREVAALLRIRKVAQIHARAVEAVATDDRTAARTLSRELIRLYDGRPETARGRGALARHIEEIIDGRDLIGLAETELMLPFDDAARKLVMASARRVALVTAISPRALVDVIFVAAQILRLIRQLASLYDGRPGTFGFLKLARAAIAHLAVTGGMAAGDSLVQQILGHGIAAKLSARLGEGVVNGLLTARVGIAAIEVCRPLPFVNARPPRLADVMAELRTLGGTGRKAAPAAEEK